MSEVTRDVTVRVSVVGGKIDKLPDFDKATTAANTFFNRVNSGIAEWQQQSSQAVGSTMAVVEQLKSVGQINISPVGLENIEQAVEAIAARQQQVSSAATTSASEQVAASETVEEAQDQVTQSLFKTIQLRERLAVISREKATEEKNAAAESTLKQIALQERLAAQRRAATDEAKQQEAEKTEATKKYSEEQQQKMLQAAGAIAQSLAAGTQFISTLRILGGESESLEELAVNFAKMQALVQGLAAGTQAFNSVNSGLAALQSAAAATTAQLAATGGTATLTQGALLRLAPAAAAAQAALGPLAIAVAAIGLAVTATAAAGEYFEADLPDDAAKSERALGRVINQLDVMRARIEANARALTAQNELLRNELELRLQIEGGAGTPQAIQESQALAMKAATDEAQSQVAAEQNAAEKRAAELRQQRNALLKEKADIERERQETRDWWGRGSDVSAEKKQREREIGMELQALQPRIIDEVTASQGVDVQLTAASMAEFAAAIERLPQDQQAAYEEVLSKFATGLQQSLTTANNDMQSAIRENELAVTENQRKQDEARKLFEAEQNIALDMQASPAKQQEIQQQINAAANAGNLNAGIDALGGVVSGEREQQLRNQLAEGSLTREQLLQELVDASEFETEKTALEKEIGILQQQAEALSATRTALVESQEAVKKQMQQLQEEIQQVRSAQTRR